MTVDALRVHLTHFGRTLTVDALRVHLTHFGRTLTVDALRLRRVVGVAAGADAAVVGADVRLVAVAVLERQVALLRLLTRLSVLSYNSDVKVT